MTSQPNPRPALAALAFGALLGGVACSPQAQPSGKVVRIHDGDTISVMRGGKAVKVRLEGIDCPELGQAFGRRAKQFTARLVAKQVVRIDVRDHDQYGRIVGRVFVAEKDVSLELVRAGLAWHYKRHSDEKALATAEREARVARRGLWKDSEPVPPWDYRRQRR